ncbi:hypothetical protein BELL_0210g00120 [Botrytis elliptica]|uniref:Uncharacterized protein n=1 Tax=Botrytis elliptica TaxID=278938 RepID=A0A4Z1JPU8_9HELO|nr:hypothetical protein EAE99_008766 [Botrytis elliptica]TGO75496.1 hypothetical protein BELL_0210g00120 [Botrytis elliptica]
MNPLVGLTYDIWDPVTHKTACYFELDMYDLLCTVAYKPDFIDEDAIMSDKQKALPRDAKDQDYYFRSLELIPGFPFWEFQGASAIKDNPDTPNTLHHNVTKRFLDFIKRAPPEIRTNIFAQIPSKRVAEVDDLDSFAHVKKSPYLMQDYSTLYNELQFAPVKYSIQVTSKGTFNEDKRLEIQNAQVDIPPFNWCFERSFAVHTDITCSKDKEKTMGIVYIENDYPNCFARSHVDFIKFAASLAHSEGFYFEKDSVDSNAGIWKSEIRKSSLLREFLAWFWKKFGVNFTNELEASFAWSKVNHAKFRYLQNISLDILVMEPLTHTRKYVDGRRVKLFLGELHNFPNIESLTVFLQIEDTDLADLIHSPGAYRWANALREITFAKYFDVQFQMLNGMLPKGPSCHAVYRRRLRQLLMPECLCYGTTDDVPDHLGIREMFAMEE